MIKEKYASSLKLPKFVTMLSSRQKCFVKERFIDFAQFFLWLLTLNSKKRGGQRAEGRAVTSANWKSSASDCEKSIKSRTEFTVDRRNGGSLTLRVSTFHDLHVLRTQSNFVKSIKTHWSTCSRNGGTFDAL